MSCRLVCSALLVAAAACQIDGSEPVPFVAPEPTPPYLPVPPAQAARRLVLLHTNDEHSHLLGFGPQSDYVFLPEFSGSFTPGGWAVDPEATAASISQKLATNVDRETVGGIVRRQYLINRERAAAAATATPVLLLSAGDVSMGSAFHIAYAAGQAPDLLAMAFLGYDFITLGNHEFDFGPDLLAASIAGANVTTFGGGVPILAGNMYFTDVQAGGPGEALLGLFDEGDSGAPIMPWATRQLSNGLKVGLFGLMGYEAALFAPNKAPIAFSAPPGGADCGPALPCTAGLSCVRRHCVDPLDAAGHLAALVDDAQRLTDRLRNQAGVDLVIALSHLGIDEDTALAAETTGIDVIIGGHSHSEVLAHRVNESIIVQAGDYGRKLGKLTLTIAPDGAIDVVPSASALLDVDWRIDAELRGATALAGVERATAFTAGLIGGLIGTLNEQLVTPLAGDFLGLGVESLVQPLVGVTSNHPIVGERAHRDSHLAHLVTDAVLDRIANHKCFVDRPVVAVQANGVLRETLRFSSRDARTTVADIFGVVPLGGSPYQRTKATPGYPVVMFKLNAVEMLAGLDIGVSRGLASDAFFLSYAGMRTRYDTSRPPFDPTAPDPWATGMIVRIELEREPFSGDFFTLYDASAATPWRDDEGDPIDPQGYLVTIATNFYLAGFLDTFGLSPRDEDGAPIAGASMTERLAPTVVCYNVSATISHDLGCLVGVAPLKMCNTLAGWPLLDELPELKEWEAIALYLQELGDLPADRYAGTEVLEADLRVRAVAP